MLIFVPLICIRCVLDVCQKYATNEKRNEEKQQPNEQQLSRQLIRPRHLLIKLHISATLYLWRQHKTQLNNYRKNLLLPSFLWTLTTTTTLQ